jgi:hypothetical protein
MVQAVDRVTFGIGAQVWLRMPTCTAPRPARQSTSPGQEAVSRLLDRGFKLVFWSDQREKGPREPGWLERAAAGGYQLEHYRDGMQVGILHGVPLAGDQQRIVCDVDIDWADGQDVALLMLPTTRFLWGRKSKPASHLLYTVSPGAQQFTFKDVGQQPATLLEFRPDVHQSMAPPSVWQKDGLREPLVLRADGYLAHFPHEELKRRCTLTAIAMLLAKHLGKYGFGHETRLAWAGFLMRLDVSDEELIQMGTALSKACQNTEVDDVRKVVQSTRTNLNTDGKKVKGGPALANIIGVNGRAVVSRIREWLGVSHGALLDAIERLNDHFAIVSIGNKVVVMENLDDGSIRKLWPFEEFKKFLSKERIRIATVKGGEKQVPLAPLWITHEEGRRYDTLIYDMPGGAERCGPEDYNGWLGFTVQPQRGDWCKNREHIKQIICRGDESLYAWVFNWMAALVQWPGRHAFTAIVLRGKQGAGKGHFAHLMLGGLFHKQQYLHLLGAGQLTGQFNEHLSGKVLVYADESTWGGDPKAAAKLKGLITESTVPIERKFLPLVEEPSALHIIVASNDDWPVSIPKDDRRFVVCDVDDSKRQDDSHFKPLREELSNGGKAAMLHDLLEHQIDESALRHPPSTAGKQEVMLHSLRPIERWWYEKLMNGVLLSLAAQMKESAGGRLDNTDVPVIEWPMVIPKDTLHDDYLGFLDKLRETRERRAAETELGIFLRKFANARSLRGKWEIDSLEECRDHWIKECGWSTDHRWPEHLDDEQMANRDEEGREDDVPF